MSVPNHADSRYQNAVKTKAPEKPPLFADELKAQVFEEYLRMPIVNLPVLARRYKVEISDLQAWERQEQWHIQREAEYLKGVEVLAHKLGMTDRFEILQSCWRSIRNVANNLEEKSGKGFDVVQSKVLIDCIKEIQKLEGEMRQKMNLR
jgi:hypothetical protein